MVRIATVRLPPIREAESAICVSVEDDSEVHGK